MTYDVAISYAKEEAARLDQIREELRGAHLSVWSDRGLLKVADGTGEERLVPAGVDHWGAIREAIDHAAVFVYLDSPRWRASSYCRKEHQHARERGIRIGGVGPGSALAGDAERVPDGDPAALRDAVRDGLDVARAHARVRASAFDPAIPDGEGVDWDDIVTLTEANLNATGMSISSPMTDCLEAASARHRRVRRRRGVFAGAAIFAAAVIAVVALVAWVGARNDNGQASAAARHVESLDLAAASEATENTFARLARARRAIGLEQNAATVGALRAAVEHFGEGISMHLKAEDPTVLAVADDGDVATVQSSGAVTLIAAGDERDQREVPAEAAPVIAFSPSGSTVAAIRRDGSGAEVIDSRTGRLRRVGATAGTTGVVFVSDRRAIAVGQSGAVLEFDPTELHPRARRVGGVPGPVRAVTLANAGPGGSFGLATLVDGAIEVNEIGAAAPPWRVSLPQVQAQFRLGWETIRICGDSLSVLATAAAPGVAVGFGIPYTVDPASHLVQTRSLIHSNGMICVPGGSALADDPIQGQFPFPASGTTLPDLFAGRDDRIYYALGSSENGQWAAVAGSDGTLKIVALKGHAQTRSLASEEAVAPTAEGSPLIVENGLIRSVPFDGGPMRTIGRGHGTAARGDYVDPAVGTIIGIGNEVLVVRDGSVRRRIPIDGDALAIHRGRPGINALVMPAAGDHLLEVPLDGAKATAAKMPKDVHAGSTQLSDVAELPGRHPRLVLAATDGYVDLVASPSGRLLRRRRVGPTGPVSIAVDHEGELVIGSADGRVRILNPVSLAAVSSTRVFSPGPNLVTADAAGDLVAAFGAGGEAVVLTLPGLEPITHAGPIEGLGSLAFGEGGNLYLGAEIHFVDGGGDEASLTAWPLCRACAGDPAHLQALAAKLAEPQPLSSRPSFEPASTGAEPATETATPAGVGPLRLRMTATALRRQGLIGPLRPGCELDPGQRAADLSPPLSGLAIFQDPNTRLAAIDATAGVVTASGIKIGSSAAAMLAAYPNAEYRRPEPDAPLPSGSLTITRGGGVLMTISVDSTTNLVSGINVPSPAVCE